MSALVAQPPVHSTPECDLCREPAAYETDHGTVCRGHRKKLIGVVREKLAKDGHPFAQEAAEAYVEIRRIGGDLP